MFSLLGTIYGGDGRTTFALPDLRGRAPIGHGTGPGLTPIPIGQRAGYENVTLTEQQLPSHTHSATINCVKGPGDTNEPDAAVWAKDAGSQSATYAKGTNDGMMRADAMTLGDTGSGLPVPNRSPYLGISYCIALVGIYDHDSASPGNQTALFNVNGSDLTSLMGNEMEGGGGGFEVDSNKPEYNEYTVTLPASLHAGIMGGSTMVALDLQGSVLNPGIPSLSIPSQEDPNNGAHLLFSSLEITIVPEPGSYALASSLTLLGAAIYRRRMKGDRHAV